MIAGEFRLGEVLLRERLVTKAQLNEALRHQRAHPGYIPLGQVLVNRKILTPRQLKMVLEGSAKRPRLGEVLVRNGAVTEAQLERALEEQKKVREPIGQILIKRGYLTDEKLRQAIGAQLDIPYVDLDRIQIDRGLSRTVNRSYASRHQLVPVARVAGSLTVCMNDPTDQRVIDELSQFSGLLLTVVTSSHAAIQRAFGRLYGPPGEGEPVAPDPAGPSVEPVTDSPDTLRNKYVDDTQANQKADIIVGRLLSLAIEHRSSDIHMEMLASRLQIRFRVDGILEQLELGDLQETCNQSAREVISRFKILGKLDIAERRRPQDGSFRLKVDQPGGAREVDLRLSIVPSHYGESLVVRILDRKNAPTSLAQLEFTKPVADTLRQLLNRPSGMILVTGPTGSGKSTTLYASLMTAYRPEIRVLTAEDPIEFIYDQFSQSEVNEQIGNTFAHYLRAFLRHDPEVIMVGEIRDEETAAMAFRAAQTGHLILSTLHTNSAIQAVQRLRDMKIDVNTLASSLLGVVNQRLVRRLCEECKIQVEPAEELLREFYDERPEQMKFFRSQGCPRCNRTGYRGRQTVAELWVPSQSDILLINKGAPFEDLQLNARNTMFSMADAVLHRLNDGRTTLEELIRVLPYQVIYDFRQRFGLAQVV